MLTRLDEEKNIMYCLEELRLLIEQPCRQAALTERLTTIKEKVEELYFIHVSPGHLVVFFYQEKQD